MNVVTLPGIMDSIEDIESPLYSDSFSKSISSLLSWREMSIAEFKRLLDESGYYGRYEFRNLRKYGQKMDELALWITLPHSTNFTYRYYPTYKHYFKEGYLPVRKVKGKIYKNVDYIDALKFWLKDNRVGYVSEYLYAYYVDWISVEYAKKIVKSLDTIGLTRNSVLLFDRLADVEEVYQNIIDPLI